MVAFLLPLEYLATIRKKLHVQSQLYSPTLAKTSLDTSPPAKSLSLHCKQIGRIKNSVDEQPSTLLDYIQVSDFKTTFTAMLLVLLEVDTHQCHLDFKLLDENNNVIILKIFLLQLLNEDEEYL